MSFLQRGLESHWENIFDAILGEEPHLEVRFFDSEYRKTWPNKATPDWIDADLYWAWSSKATADKCKENEAATITLENPEISPEIASILTGEFVLVDVSRKTVLASGHIEGLPIKNTAEVYVSGWEMKVDFDDSGSDDYIPNELNSVEFHELYNSGEYDAD